MGPNETVIDFFVLKNIKIYVITPICYGFRIKIKLEIVALWPGKTNGRYYNKFIYAQRRLANYTLITPKKSDIINKY
ncbi:MAG: hypothetical protein BGO48_00255 [Mucilaginibacter sp. 44-25]|nr:MAG: hypothetical protein BGO48_00255 [Mucilaginibacter sp. 44-25]